MFGLGATAGGRVLSTEIDSLRLCPGTPSNTSLLRDPAPEADTARTIFGGSWIPCLSAAAFVMRGAMAGAAVDATWIVDERLCPGTSINACFCSSRVGATLGPRAVTSKSTPARSAAAFVIRGVMLGEAVVEGTGRARNTGLPVLSTRLLGVPGDERVVTDEGGYAPELLRCIVSIIWEVSELGGYWVDDAGELSSSGRSWVGYIGEDAKRDAIWISAVWVSGEPMIPFCCKDSP